MNQVLRNRVSLNALVFAVFIGLFWTNVALHLNGFLDFESEAFEMYDPFDSETEEEKKNEEVKDDKIPMAHRKLKLIYPIQKITPFLTEPSQSLHHPEISTPPPECIFQS